MRRSALMNEGALSSVLDQGWYPSGHRWALQTECELLDCLAIREQRAVETKMINFLLSSTAAGRTGGRSNICLHYFTSQLPARPSVCLPACPPACKQTKLKIVIKLLLLFTFFFRCCHHYCTFPLPFRYFIYNL